MLKRKTPLRRVSKKRQREMKEYGPRKASYFQRLAKKQQGLGLNPPDDFTPWCEVCLAEEWELMPAEDWHHVLPKGRGGKQNQEEGLMIAVSRLAHRKIHDDPQWSEKRGYLIK